VQSDTATPQIIAPHPRGFRQRAEEWFKIAGMFLWGIAIACLAGQELLGRHWPHSRWRGACVIIIFIWATIDLVRPKPKQPGGEALGIGLAILLVPLYLLRSHIWVPPAIGVVFGGFLWANGELRRHPIPIAVSGSVLGSVATLLVPWPNPERALLACVFAGGAIALQGVWIIIGHISGLHRVTAPASAQTGRSSIRFLHLTFGKIETEQINWPGLEHQLRMRNHFQIDELESLGFRYLCCYTESFSASRLMFLLPVLVVLDMQRGREMIRLRGGRIHTHFMLLVSGDKTTFAHAFGLGVKFHTGFSDGTFLVTMNANAAIPDIDRPPMLKRYRKGSIADAWADHQSAIQSLEAAGKRAVRQVSFHSFADMSQRETELQSQS
jgi:hypothetical protein